MGWQSGIGLRLYANIFSPYYNPAIAHLQMAATVARAERTSQKGRQRGQTSHSQVPAARGASVRQTRLWSPWLVTLGAPRGCWRGELTFLICSVPNSLALTPGLKSFIWRLSGPQVNCLTLKNQEKAAGLRVQGSPCQGAVSSQVAGPAGGPGSAAV